MGEAEALVPDWTDEEVFELESLTATIGLPRLTNCGAIDGVKALRQEGVPLGLKIEPHEAVPGRPIFIPDNWRSADWYPTPSVRWRWLRKTCFEMNLEPLWDEGPDREVSMEWIQKRQSFGDELAAFITSFDSPFDSPLARWLADRRRASQKWLTQAPQASELDFESLCEESVMSARFLMNKPLKYLHRSEMDQIVADVAQKWNQQQHNEFSVALLQTSTSRWPNGFNFDEDWLRDSLRYSNALRYAPVTWCKGFKKWLAAEGMKDVEPLEAASIRSRDNGGKFAADSLLPRKSEVNKYPKYQVPPNVPDYNGGWTPHNIYRDPFTPR